MTKEDVEKYARKVAGITKFATGDDPTEVVAQLGGRCKILDMSDWVEETGSIYVHREYDFDIILPRYTSPLRDRFTICHELGHFFLHSNMGEVPIVAYRQGSTRIEWEANWFAASLLMPKVEFLAALKETDDLTRIAAKFKVSCEAARVRKEAIG